MKHINWALLFLLLLNFIVWGIVFALYISCKNSIAYPIIYKHKPAGAVVHFNISIPGSPIDNGIHWAEVDTISPMETDRLCLRNPAHPEIPENMIFLPGDTILITSGWAGDKGEKVKVVGLRNNDYVDINRTIYIEDGYWVFMCMANGPNESVVCPNDGDGDGIIEVDIGAFEWIPPEEQEECFLNTILENK